jgi:hypothetical protein
VGERPASEIGEMIWQANPLINRKTEAHLLSRAEAAVLMMEGRIDDAMNRMNESREAIRKLPETGFTVAESDWLERIPSIRVG